MLMLDSEAVSAIAHGPAPRRDRVRALVQQMRGRDLPVATVAAVLAEVVRGRPADAGVFAGLRRERVIVFPVDSRVGVRAGQLLGKAGFASRHAVDAFVVASADLAGGAVIATSDRRDIARLAEPCPGVAVASLGG